MICVSVFGLCRYEQQKQAYEAGYSAAFLRKDMSPASIQQGGASGSGSSGVAAMNMSPALAARHRRRKKDPDMPRRNMYVCSLPLPLLSQEEAPLLLARGRRNMYIYSLPLIARGRRKLPPPPPPLPGGSSLPLLPLPGRRLPPPPLFAVAGRTCTFSPSLLSLSPQLQPRPNLTGMPFGRLMCL